MSAAQLEAYKSAQKSVMSGREIEAMALTKAALQLKKCRNNWDPDDKSRERSDSLEKNQKIWSILQGELAREDNPLPKQLRQDLLSLSLFIDKRTFDVMANPSPEKLDILININLNIASGLRSNPS